MTLEFSHIEVAASPTRDAGEQIDSIAKGSVRISAEAASNREKTQSEDLEKQLVSIDVWEEMAGIWHASIYIIQPDASTRLRMWAAMNSMTTQAVQIAGRGLLTLTSGDRGAVPACGCVWDPRAEASRQPASDNKRLRCCQGLPRAAPLAGRP